MRIFKLLRIGLGVLFAGCTMAVYAADINVPPGTGTLAAAVASASNGDTLILQEGGYNGDVTLDKSLVIRAQTRTTNAVVAGIFKVEGAGIEVTVQGLTFSQTSQIWQGSAVRLLQNHWVSGSIDVTNYKTAEGDGSLVVIGNTLTNGSISVVSSENAYLAGNVLLNGVISTAASVWIVGNDISTNGGRAVESTGAGTSVRIIGNRILCYANRCINTQLAAISIIQNNLLVGQSVGTQSFTGIYVGINATVVNNTISQTLRSDNNNYGIVCGSGYTSGGIIGNIIVGTNLAQVCNQVVPTEITNNLCFGNLSNNCPTGNGNLNDIDPQFVDLVDYLLSPSSPAIDAGPSNFELADLDRSRNDMGAYGGPWSIGQYDLQRDPSNYAPYVYPLFQGGAAFSGGTLDVQALGAAKLR